MLTVLTKVSVFLLAVVGLAYGAALLSESGQFIRIATSSAEITLGPLQAVIVAALLVLAIWLTIRVLAFSYAFIRFLNGDETAISRYFDRNREKKGHQALADGLIALAAGEAKLALSHAAKADRYLGRPASTALLIAQAAEAAGDTSKSASAYKKLLAEDKTRFVALTGLMRQKLAEGDKETALKLAEKAFALKPRHAEVQDTLLALQSESGDWKGARQVLSAKVKQGVLPKDLHKRRDAVMALQEAKAVFEEGVSVEAQEAAIAANKASPDLIPAAAMAARAYLEKGQPKEAARVLQKAWAVQPHPDLASAYAEIAPDEDAVARLKRFDPLLKQAPDAEESRLLQAELLIGAEDFPAARRALSGVIETNPTARALTLMAAVERGEGAEDAVVRGWLAKAVAAPRGKQWVCESCNTVHADWAPVCGNCQGFDTLAWKAHDTGAPLPHGAEMLPLIVGKPMPQPAPEDELPLEDVVGLSRRTP